MPPTGDSLAVIKPRTEGEEADLGGSHRAESNSPPPASLAYDARTFELHQNGELYPKKKVPGRGNVNCGYSLNDVATYAAEVAAHVMPTGESPNEHLPHHSSSDYVHTLFEAAQSNTTSRFVFANHAKRYLDHVAVALNSVSPGYVFGIHNG